MTSITTSATQTRSLRLSVPADMYAEIERLAKTCDISVAMAAKFVLAFGLAAIDVHTEREIAREDATPACTPGVADPGKITG